MQYSEQIGCDKPINTSPNFYWYTTDPRSDGVSELPGFLPYEYRFSPTLAHQDPNFSDAVGTVVVKNDAGTSRMLTNGCSKVNKQSENFFQVQYFPGFIQYLPIIKKMVLEKPTEIILTQLTSKLQFKLLKDKIKSTHYQRDITPAHPTFILNKLNEDCREEGKVI